ncbi:MAG TPA: FAD-dependent monooxygenase, partial [Steroidobacteraceae bacterium]|nr:FAD-dependent monooxygenase [Steroidobacteraceae bacterium]
MKTDRSAKMNEHAVVIAGGGPTGLMLAGVDVAIVERRANQELTGSRAGGLHSRTIEVLDQRGIADRFLAQGKVHHVAHFNIPLDLSDFPTRHNYVLGLWQRHFERILAGWVDELAVPIYRGREVTGFAQDDTGVDVELSAPQGPRPPSGREAVRSLRATYLVGCDGGRSLVRKTAGIEFAGWDPTMSWLLAEVETAEEPKWGLHRDARGIHAIARSESGGARIVLTEPQLRLDSEPTLSDVSEALVAVYGTDYGIHSPTWISRFTDMTRQATRYCNRRVLLAGDAAHVHPPIGGQGLNIGVQDAVNLGWKLAQVVKRTSPESLLYTYHAERHPVAARVLRNTMAQVALRRQDDRTKALDAVVSELMSTAETRKRFAAELSGLDVRYDLGRSEADAGHPLIGRRMPDLDLVTAAGPLRFFSLLHQARPVLLNFGATGRFDIAQWADRVQLLDANYAGSWELPAIGVVAAPTAVLVRPDGYVAWAGVQTRPGLTDALNRWFGPPAAAHDFHHL